MNATTKKFGFPFVCYRKSVRCHHFRSISKLIILLCSTFISMHRITQNLPLPTVFCHIFCHVLSKNYRTHTLSNIKRYQLFSSARVHRYRIKNWRNIFRLFFFQKFLQKGSIWSVEKMSFKSDKFKLRGKYSFRRMKKSQFS